MFWLLIVVLCSFYQTLNCCALATEVAKPTYQIHYQQPKQQNIYDHLTVVLQTNKISNKPSAKDYAFYHNKSLQASMLSLIQNLFLLNNGTKSERAAAFYSIAFGQHCQELPAMRKSLQKILQTKCSDDGKLLHLEHDDYMTACIYKALKETVPHKIYLEILKLFNDKTSAHILIAETSSTMWGYWLALFWEKLNRLLNDCTKHASCTLENIKKHPFNLQLKKLFEHIANKQYIQAQQLARYDPLFKEVFQESCNEYIQEQKQQGIQSIATEQLPLLFDTEVNDDIHRFKVAPQPVPMNRFDALHNTLAQQAFITKHHVLSAKSKQLLSTFGINACEYTQFYGNQMQQALHHEHLHIIDSSAGIYFIPGQKQHIKDIIEHTIHFVDCAHHYNQAGFLKKALTVTDCCWAFLQYAKSITKGLGKGTYKGIKNYVDNAIDHPLEAISRPIIGNVLLACQLAQLTLQVADKTLIGISAYAGNEHSKKEWKYLCTNITTVKNALYEKYKNMNLEESVSEITALAAETLLDYKCAKTLHKFYQTGERKTLELIGKLNNNLPPPSLHAVALTPEGFEIGVASQAATIAAGNKKLVFAKLENSGIKNSLFLSTIRTIEKEKKEEIKYESKIYSSSPVGYKGKEIRVIPGTNSRTIINEREYTGHALDRMQQRGILPSIVENAILNGEKIPNKKPGCFIHYDKINKVNVVTAHGKVVTVSYGRPFNGK